MDSPTILIKGVEFSRLELEREESMPKTTVGPVSCLEAGIDQASVLAEGLAARSSTTFTQLQARPLQSRQV